MPKLDQDNQPDGEIRLRELFDTLVHNRYYHFDEARIRDVFSSDPPTKRSLSNRFMGYAFDLEAFAKTILDIVHEIQFKELTRIIRHRFKLLSSDSKPQDIVFLVQNVESLSHLLKTKTHSDAYGFIRNALFTDAGIRFDGPP